MFKSYIINIIMVHEELYYILDVRGHNVSDPYWSLQDRMQFDW